MNEHKDNNRLLIDRVNGILESTPASDWQQGGHAFKPGIRADKPKETWEWAYCINISSGVLLFRSSVPVRSAFAGRGFVLVALQQPRYTVELRPTAWRLNDLINPQRVQTANSEFTLLAEGETAYEIFSFVSKRIDSLNQDSLSKLKIASEDLIKKLEDVEIVNNIFWKDLSEDPEITHFTGEFEEMTIDIYRHYSINEGAKFAMKLSDETNSVAIKKPMFASQLFRIIEEQFKTSKLVKLAKVLEEEL